jgi:hypothetical protein
MSLSAQSFISSTLLNFCLLLSTSLLTWSTHHVHGLPLGILTFVFIYNNSFSVLCSSILLTHPNHLSPLLSVWLYVCQFKGHLFKLGLVNSPTCERCHSNEETALHVLCECEALAKVSFCHLVTYFMGPSNYRGIQPNKILHFARSLGLFAGWKIGIATSLGLFTGWKDWGPQNIHMTVALHWLIRGPTPSTFNEFCISSTLSSPLIYEFLILCLMVFPNVHLLVVYIPLCLSTCPRLCCIQEYIFKICILYCNFTFPAYIFIP